MSNDVNFVMNSSQGGGGGVGEGYPFSGGAFPYRPS